MSTLDRALACLAAYRDRAAFGRCYGCRCATQREYGQITGIPFVRCRALGPVSPVPWETPCPYEGR